jgi:hydrogenase nickel incorporation protein HypA/HybF
MHELSIAQSVVDVVEDEARRAGVERVISVTISLGELSGVVEEQLRFCFPMVARGTIVEGSALKIELVAGIGWCPICGAEYHLTSMLTPCPQCGGFTSEIRAGRELLVARLEVE